MLKREIVLKALNCCKKQKLEACEKCPLQGKCRDGKVLLEACIAIIREDGRVRSK